MRHKTVIPLEVLSRYFHLTQKEAAAALGVCQNVVKSLCKEYGIKRWPHRKLASLKRKTAKGEVSRPNLEGLSKPNSPQFSVSTSSVSSPSSTGSSYTPHLSTNNIFCMEFGTSLSLSKPLFDSSALVNAPPTKQESEDTVSEETDNAKILELCFDKVDTMTSCLRSFCNKNSARKLSNSIVMTLPHPLKAKNGNKKNQTTQRIFDAEQLLRRKGGAKVTNGETPISESSFTENGVFNLDNNFNVDVDLDLGLDTINTPIIPKYEYQQKIQAFPHGELLSSQDIESLELLLDDKKPDQVNLTTPESDTQEEENLLDMKSPRAPSLFNDFVNALSEDIVENDSISNFDVSFWLNQTTL